MWFQIDYWPKLLVLLKMSTRTFWDIFSIRKALTSVPQVFLFVFIVRNQNLKSLKLILQLNCQLPTFENFLNHISMPCAFNCCEEEGGGREWKGRRIVYISNFFIFIFHFIWYLQCLRGWQKKSPAQAVSSTSNKLSLKISKIFHRQFHSINNIRLR